MPDVLSVRHVVYMAAVCIEMVVLWSCKALINVYGYKILYAIRNFVIGLRLFPMPD